MRRALTAAVLSLSIAVSGAFLLVPAAHGTCALTMSARLAAGGGYH